MRSLSILLGSLCVFLSQVVAGESSKPNVLFVIVDDLNCRIACYGDPVAKTLSVSRSGATLVLAVALFLQTVWAEGPGKRPYELDWAKRFDDDHPPLVDFEDLRGWTVKASRGEAAWSRSSGRSNCLATVG
jgi:hypothetical protein